MQGPGRFRVWCFRVSTLVLNGFTGSLGCRLWVHGATLSPSMHMLRCHLGAVMGVGVSGSGSEASGFGVGLRGDLRFRP